MNNIIVSILILFFCSCASLRDKKIEIPQDIEEKSKVIVLVDNEVKHDQKQEYKEKISSKKESAVVIKKQEPVVAAKINNPFKVGERIVTELSYLGFTAAVLITETKAFVKINEKKAFHFYGTALSSGLMNLIYKVNDVVEVFFDAKDFVPLKMAIHLNESKQNVEQIVLYDHENKKANYWKKRIDSKDHVTEVRREDVIVPFSQDLLSIYYYARTINYELGKTYDIVLYDNNKTWTISVEVVGEEKVWTPIGSLDTYILKPTIRFAGAIVDKGEILVWVTKDERRIPIKFKSKVKIGSVSGLIREYKLD